MAVPDTDHYRQALKRGDTLPARPCLHWVESKVGWIERARSGAQIIGVELDDDSIPLQQVRQATKNSVVLLGHEHSGLPPEVMTYLDHVIEIPMLGVGRSLNVAVAGSLVLYKLAGLS
jgi:tRNA G18 (ribose-2'-O)-methylase SpoU